MKLKVIMRVFITVLFGIFNYYYEIGANCGPVIGGHLSFPVSSSVSREGFWSVFDNQAGLASYDHISAGISYENRYLINEISTKSIALILPLQQGVFGLSLSYYGYDLYNEKKIGLAFARSFGEILSAGVQLDYCGISIGNEYGNKDLFTFETGIQVKLRNSINLGLHIFNPSHAKITHQDNERIPTISRLGVSYIFSEKVDSFIELEKSSGHDAILKAGIEYHPSRTISFRSGIGTKPFINSFGAGYRFQSFVIDIDSAYDAYLGFITRISIIIELRSRDKEIRRN